MALKRYRIDYRTTIDVTVVVESALPPERFGMREAEQALAQSKMIAAEGDAEILREEAPIISEVYPEED